MSGGSTSHIRVTYTDGDAEVTCIYAVNEDISREFGRKYNPSGKALQKWLEAKGCRLDSSDGPALIRRDADGTTVEEYYRDGELHRGDGPA